MGAGRPARRPATPRSPRVLAGKAARFAPLRASRPPCWSPRRPPPASRGRRPRRPSRWRTPGPARAGARARRPPTPSARRSRTRAAARPATGARARCSPCPTPGTRCSAPTPAAARSTASSRSWPGSRYRAARRRARRPLPAAALLPADLAGLRPAPREPRPPPGAPRATIGATVYGVERAAVRALTGRAGRARAMRVPGLRRGVAVLRGGLRIVDMREVEWVRGLRVSGRLGDGGDTPGGRRGRPRRAGVLARGAGRTLRGTLGGERGAGRPPSSGLDRPPVLQRPCNLAGRTLVPTRGEERGGARERGTRRAGRRARPVLPREGDLGRRHGAGALGRDRRRPRRRRADADVGWCPFAARILDDVREAVEALDGVDSASVEIIWDKAWTPTGCRPPPRQAALPARARRGRRPRRLPHPPAHR